MGNSPLHFAIYCNQEKVLRILLTHGVNINIVDNLGRYSFVLLCLKK